MTNMFGECVVMSLINAECLALILHLLRRNNKSYIVEFFHTLFMNRTDLDNFKRTSNFILSYFSMITRTWANAQRDGRPAKYRWRPLFNVANFGWRPQLECCAVTLPRRESRWNLLGCPKQPNRSQPLVGQSSPYCEDMRRRYCCLTIFSDCWYDTYLTCEDIARQSCEMVPRYRFFGDCFASCIFSEPSAARFRPVS